MGFAVIANRLKSRKTKKEVAMADFQASQMESFKMKSSFWNEQENENSMHRIMPRGKIKCTKYDM